MKILLVHLVPARTEPQKRKVRTYVSIIEEVSLNYNQTNFAGIQTTTTCTST